MRDKSLFYELCYGLESMRWRCYRSVAADYAGAVDLKSVDVITAP